MVEPKDSGTTDLVTAQRAEVVVQMEQEQKEYDLITDVVSPERQRELQEALKVAKELYPYLGATSSTNDILAQLVAYKGICETFVPADHPRPVVVPQRDEPTAPWVVKYKSYFVWEPNSELTHRVIKTAQKPQEGNPYFTLAISTLTSDQYQIPHYSKHLKKIEPPIDRNE